MIEAGAKANAICLNLTETAKVNEIDFFQYLMKLMTEFPNVAFHKHPEVYLLAVLEYDISINIELKIFGEDLNRIYG